MSFQVFIFEDLIDKVRSLSNTMYYTSEYITLSTSGAVPYQYKLFRYSYDRYGTTCAHTCSRTVPIHLSTLQNERSKLYRNGLFWDVPHKRLGHGAERNGMTNTFTDVDS